MTTREQIIDLRNECDEFAEQTLQCTGEFHPDFHTVSDERFYTIAYEAGAASRDVEIADLKRELDNEQARDIHSCHPNCARNGCVNRRLRSELEAARAEIERLKTVPMKYRRMTFNAELQDENARLNKQLAAEQAKNVGLREALHYSLGAWEYDGISDEHGSIFQEACSRCDAPSNDSALEAIVKKATEVMRKRCAQSADDNCHFATCDSIQLLPAVTLEDLK